MRTPDTPTASPWQDADVKDPQTREAKHRTLLAQERTLLAWWRSGLASLAVALAVGRLLPALLEESHRQFAILGVGFAGLGLLFIGYGSARDRRLRRAFEEDRFHPVDGWALGLLTGLLVLLALATVVLAAEPL